jgi:hypothetical protein
VNNIEFLNAEVLDDYLQGKLDAKTMHQIERISLNDAFVEEALAGLMQSTKRDQTLSILQKQLQERVAQKPLAKKAWQNMSQRLSIASVAAVLFISGSVLFWIKETNRKQLLAKQTKSVEVNIAATNGKNSTSSQNVTQPAIGWTAYQKYLKTNNKLVKNGLINQFVALSFHVDQSGNPVQIKIVHSIGIDYDKEAIRLIDTGPKWNYIPNRSAPIVVRIGF